ncbi:helix-turn-helix domain-containing protein [Paenibacillus marinisediminis]
MTSTNIGRNIGDLRKSIGITQEILAEAVGVTAQAVSKWEGGGSPDIELLPSIANYFGVSIDRLFGRTINDYANVENEFAKQVASEGQDTAIQKAFHLCWAMERGFVGDTQMEPHTSLDAILKKETGHIFSQMLFDNGITLMSLRNDLQYFVIIPEPDCGWLKELGNQEEYLKLFRLLADSDILKSLYVLYGRENKPFTPKLLERELSLTVERGTEILEILKDYSLITTSEIELDDIVQKVYNFRPNPAFIAILALCLEMVKRPNFFYGNINNRSLPYLQTSKIPSSI